MAQNVEIKARAQSWDDQLGIAQMCAEFDCVLEQRDIFYACPGGRLKLRIARTEMDGTPTATLIFYDRPDQQGPKTSEFSRAQVQTPDDLHAVLARAYGVVAEVRKRRTRLVNGNVAIHFDEVEGLGRFIELEVALDPGQSEGEGVTAVDAFSQRNVSSLLRQFSGRV